MTPRVLFVTTGLLTGGAERQLARLLSHLHGHAVEAAVVSLFSPGPVSHEIAALGVPVWHLGLENPARIPLAVGRLVAIARRFRPDIVQGWMHHGNLAALWINHWLRRTHLVFGVRQSLHEIGREKWLTQKAIRWNAAASGRASAIVYNSETARVQHEAFGFTRHCGLVIDNGFDTSLFCPDEAARRSVRVELGLSSDAFLVGFFARNHPMKGHEVFLRAAERLATHRPDVHFVLAGTGVAADHPPFCDCAANAVLAGRLHLLGERTDIPRLTAALDIATSASSAEAFPNTIGEAMSCGVLCVATNVGDVPRILDGIGIVVPVANVHALAEGWERVLSLSAGERAHLAEGARTRAIERFRIDAVAKRYADLYDRIVAGGRPPHDPFV